MAGVVKIPTGFSEGLGELITLSRPHSNWVITFDLLKPPRTSRHCVWVTPSHTVHHPRALLVLNLTPSGGSLSAVGSISLGYREFGTSL